MGRDAGGVVRSRAGAGRFRRGASGDRGGVRHRRIEGCVWMRREIQRSAFRISGLPPSCNVQRRVPQGPGYVESRRSIAWDERCAPGL